MPPCSVSHKGHCYLLRTLHVRVLLLLVMALSHGTEGRVHMLYWNASNPLLVGGDNNNPLRVNTNLDEQQYDQVYIYSMLLSVLLCCTFYATEMYITHFLDAARFPKAPV